MCIAYVSQGDKQVIFHGSTERGQLWNTMASVDERSAALEREHNAVHVELGGLQQQISDRDQHITSVMEKSWNRGTP